MWKMINFIWEKETIPEEWNMSILCPVFKKGDILDTKNYRGISLLDTCYKVLLTILLEWITPYTEEIIGRYQCGFRKGRSTTDQIFILKQVMEKHYKFDKDLYMVFVDYKQAYDSINRKELWNSMIYFGIPKKYVNMVKLCNDKTECKMRFLGELSSDFEVNSGLRQGDALSPTLFNLGLEKVIRELNHSHQVKVANKEIILAYADDIVILGNSRQEVTQTMSNLMAASKRTGLCVNEEKTKFMVLSKREEDQPNLQVDNLTFEKVESFKYLCVNLNSKNNMHQKIVERLASGNRCYHSIQKVLKSKLLSRRSKTLLYISYLRPIVT
jgi:hypothetical protein